MRAESENLVDGRDGPAAAVINLPPGGVVRDRGGTVAPWVLGPDGRVQVKTNWETDSGPLGVFAGRVDVFGGVIR